MHRHPVIAYFGLAVALSWAIEVPLALQHEGRLHTQLPYALHYAAAFGPLLAALCVTFVWRGASGLRELGERAIRWRIGLGWWLVAVGSPVALFAIGVISSRVAHGAWPDLARIGEVNFLGDIGLLAIPLWILTFGFGEEVGWRGFALQHLQPRRGAMRATLIVAAVWATWHLPSFFYLPSYLELGLAGFPGFVVGLTLGAVLLTWLYNGSRGSILAVALWHALYDLFSASGATDVAANTAMSIAIVLWALGVLALGLQPAATGRSGVSAMLASRRTSHAHTTS